MNWYKKAQNNIAKYNYIGDCISIVDDACIWDATEMAQLIQNSTPITYQEFFNLTNKFLKDFLDFEFGKYENIVWMWDTNKDIHYFYQRIL